MSAHDGRTGTGQWKGVLGDATCGRLETANLVAGKFAKPESGVGGVDHPQRAGERSGDRIVCELLRGVVEVGYHIARCLGEVHLWDC